MTALSDLARGLGDDGAVAPLERRTALLREQVLSDPLTYAPNGLPAAEIQRAATELAADLATAMPACVRSRVCGTATRAASKHSSPTSTCSPRRRRRPRLRSHARPKRSPRPGSHRAPASAAVLRNRIGELDGLHAQQQWRRLADDAATVRAATDRAIERARELRAAADGLVARRDELRGRLDGYRAKAATYRLDEHDDLGPLHVHARTLLYTAPCDLSAATKAVVAYQTTLAGLLGAGPVTGGNEAT